MGPCCTLHDDIVNKFPAKEGEGVPSRAPDLGYVQTGADNKEEKQLSRRGSANR